VLNPPAPPAANIPAPASNVPEQPTQRIFGPEPPPTQRIFGPEPPPTQRIFGPEPPPTQRIFGPEPPPTQRIFGPEPPPTQRIFGPEPPPTRGVPLFTPNRILQQAFANAQAPIMNEVNAFLRTLGNNMDASLNEVD